MPSSAEEELYPTSCAFCAISTAYPAGPHPIPANPDPDKVSPQCHLILSTPHVLAFLDIMPIAPGHILLTTRDHFRTLADLSSSPSAKNKRTDWISQRAAQQHTKTAAELGRWLPLLSRALCKVTGVEDWNVVQNNGARAAQVVPHIHFHFIPRYQEGRREVAGRSEGVGEGAMMKSWKMFGRGTREDLDDEEGAKLAAELRVALEGEIGELGEYLNAEGRLKGKL